VSPRKTIQETHSKRESSVPEPILMGPMDVVRLTELFGPKSEPRTEDSDQKERLAVRENR